VSVEITTLPSGLRVVTDAMPHLKTASLGVFVGVAAKVPARLFWPLLTASAVGLAFLYGWWPHQGLALAP